MLRKQHLCKRVRCDGIGSRVGEVLACEGIQPFLTDGQQAIVAILQRDPEAPVVVLTILADREDVYQALEAGAKGYLLKGTSREELEEHIHEVHAGKTYIASAVAGKSAEPPSGQCLTMQQETKVLHLRADGKSNKEIGTLFQIAEGTVKVHVNHILAKLGASNRTAACVAEIEHGLIRRLFAWYI